MSTLSQQAPIKAVLFDCDGVIVAGDFGRVLETQYNISAEKQNSFWQAHFAVAAMGKADLIQSLPAVLKEWGTSLSAKEFVDLWCRTDSVLNKVALRIVDVLRNNNVLVGLATNQEAHRTDYLRADLRLDRHFTHIFASCELGVMKPASAYFSSVAQVAKVLPSEILFIDDAARNVEAAAQFGMQTIQYSFDPAVDQRGVLPQLLRGKDARIDICLDKAIARHR